MPLKHDPVRRLMAMQPPADLALMPQWWRQVCTQLGITLGIGKEGDSDTITVPDSTVLESRPDDDLDGVLENLSDTGDIGNAMEYVARTGIPAKDLVQRINGLGTGIDTRLLPVAKTANLGSVIASNPLTATDAGADATITIGAFTAQFDFGTLAILGASITGLAYSTQFKVYLTGFSYIDGTYTAALATISAATLTSNPQNFYVGTITTPAAAAPPTGGSGGGGHYEP